MKVQIYLNKVYIVSFAVIQFNYIAAGADCTATNTSITFAPLATNTSITFAPLDREACVTVGIIDDTLPIEVHESFIVFFECDDGIQLTSVTIIDNDGGETILHFFILTTYIYK